MRNALSVIGNTPLLKLGRLTSQSDANVYVKCEFLNPSGSIKDRMALRMVEDAERKQKLQKDGTIVDATSGNTGPALSFVGAVKGYKVKLLIPAKWAGPYNPENRIRIMKSYGAEVQAFSTEGYKKLIDGLSPSETSAAIFAIGMKKCFELQTSDPRVWWANQMCNMDNAEANRLTTGEEILEQLDEKVDAFVASIGTGGTILGVAEALLDRIGHVKVVGLEPEDARVTEWFTSGSMIKYMNSVGLPQMKSIVEVMLETGIPDEVMTVRDIDARSTMNRLCREEGLFCGMSSGANVFAALRIAKELGRGANVVTVLVDRRERYFPESPQEHYVI
jgi:cysteine synthase